MALPQPELGLVVHYGFVWSGADRRPPPDAGKDRPCLIVDLFEIQETPGRKTLRVTYLPISHTEPRDGDSAKLISPRVANHLKLTGQKSYLYTSYACEDDWPFDLPGAWSQGSIPLWRDPARAVRCRDRRVQDILGSTAELRPQALESLSGRIFLRENWCPLFRKML